MNEFIKKLIERLEELKKIETDSEDYVDENGHYDDVELAFDDGKSQGRYQAYCRVTKIVTQLAKEYDQTIDVAELVEKFGQEKVRSNDGWISCEEQMPPVETEVLIVAKRKWRDGTCGYITTTAMYEDGTVLENDSCWRWEDVDGEWNDEAECCIIPEGWWEWKHYNGDGELNHAVDDEVIAWQPLPPAYQPKGE